MYNHKYLNKNFCCLNSPVYNVDAYKEYYITHHNSYQTITPLCDLPPPPPRKKEITPSQYAFDFKNSSQGNNTLCAM